MRFTVALLAVVALLVPFAAFSQPVSPAPGSGAELPQGYYDQIAKDPTAFQFQKAWLQKAQRAKQARKAYFETASLPEGLTMASLPDHIRSQVAVSGTLTVPMICIDYNNVAAPFTVPTVDGQYWVGPTTSDGTVTQLYTEMSYGLLNMVGDVLGWVNGASNDSFYEGGCNGLCGSAKTGQLVLEALNGVDGSTDFGAYDNDGPDGIPNSGDDDGFVDFIAIVHPESGGECGGTNMWSHRWVVAGWPEFSGNPWTSNDAAFGGGFIRVFDYTIQPVQGGTNGCGPGINHIGVFGHEFGHALGLPDFYDTNGGGQGIGEHGLMGSGNWQLSSNPTHMTSFSKQELGWMAPPEVGPVLSAYGIDDQETNADAYRLNIYEEKFNRKTFQPLNGTASMHCGLPTAAANARNWLGGSGYGNGYAERVEHTFGYDGNDPVTLIYDVSYDTEATYDFGRVIIEVNGIETIKASYDGVGSASAVNINLTPQLTGSGATTYRVILEFTSDTAWSDEDGQYLSGAGGPFKLDDVSVNGGGESYFTDFEVYEDGWCYGVAPQEYFLVANTSQANGLFGNNTNGQGLQILHIDETVANNTSGSITNTNLRPAIHAVECADGLNHLLLGTNRGDAGDYWHSGTQATFDNATTPNSKSNNNFATNVLVQSISAASASMTADMRAGRLAPTLTSVTPTSGDNDQIVSITELLGSLMYKGGTFCLDDGVNTAASLTVDWTGKAKVGGTIDLNGLPAGPYDVVWKGPDGQEARIVDGFTVNAVATGIGDELPRSNALFQNRPNPFNPTTTITYTIKRQSPVTLRIYNAAGQRVRNLVDEVQSPNPLGFSVVWDGRNDSGAQVASGVYMYKLSIGSEFQDVKKLVLLK